MTSTATLSATDEDDMFGRIPTHGGQNTIGIASPDDEDDDVMGRIPTSTKPVYGANTIEISCDLDAEDEAEFGTQEMGTSYERP